MGGEIAFQLWGETETEYTPGKKTFGGEPVLPLPPGEPAAALDEVDTAQSRPWVSWFEKWKKEPNGTFALRAAKWTVFWGLPNVEDKVQVLRAEWDRTTLESNGKSHAAQPHWHIDQSLELYEGAAIETGPSELREIPSVGGAAGFSGSLSLERAHLPMGGWKNRSVPANCWHFDVSADLDELQDWCVKTLIYLKTQRRFLQSSQPPTY